jgi:putative membrane protein
VILEQRQVGRLRPPIGQSVGRVLAREQERTSRGIADDFVRVVEQKRFSRANSDRSGRSLRCRRAAVASASEAFRLLSTTLRASAYRVRKPQELMATRTNRALAVLAGLFALEFAVLAISPNSRSDWLLENALPVAAVGALALTYRRFRFSRLSYGMVFVFLSLHEIGAHYTYSLVPYDAAIQRWFGFSLDLACGFHRNMYDRLVHFAYGLLLAYPIREIFLRIADVRGFWGYFLPLDLTMSTSMTYELIEWGAAMTFGGELGQAYLGTQGDVWDTHKDMALASLGALVAMAVTLVVNRALGRDVAAEWAASFRVVHPDPLGEGEIARTLAKPGP